MCKIFILPPTFKTPNSPAETNCNWFVAPSNSKKNSLYYHQAVFHLLLCAFYSLLLPCNLLSNFKDVGLTNFRDLTTTTVKEIQSTKPNEVFAKG